MLQQALNASREGKLIAQSWAWISKDRHLVFDSWERLRPEDDRLCEPFMRKAAEKAVLTFGFTKVLLGKGGQTPAMLNFTLANNVESPQDYFDYRDSAQAQYILAASEKHEAPIPGDEQEQAKSNERLPHYAAEQSLAAQITQVSCLFSTKSLPEEISNYTADEVNGLLAHYVRNKNIELLDAILNIDKEDVDLARLAVIKQAALHLQEPVKTFLVPLQKSNGAWVCFIFQFTQVKRDFANTTSVQPTFIYLDLAAEAIPRKLQTFLQLQNYENVYGMRDIKSLQITYEKNPVHSGPWLIDILARFADNGRFTIFPQLSLQEVQREQRNILRAASIEGKQVAFTL